MLRLRPFTRKPGPSAYQREDGPLHDGEWIEHLDGTDWFYADVPPRRHRCWPQTRGWMDRELVERCACGATRFDGYGPWVNRNSSKPRTAEEQAAMIRERDRCDAMGRLISAYGDAVKAEDRERLKEIRSQLRQLDEAAPEGQP